MSCTEPMEPCLCRRLLGLAPQSGAEVVAMEDGPCQAGTDVGEVGHCAGDRIHRRLRVIDLRSANSSFSLLSKEGELES